MAIRGKGAYPEIYDELRRVRRDADEGLTPHVLAGSPALCQLLGNGDPFLAAGELRDRLSTAAARADRAILAYYYSLNPGKNATARMTDAGGKLALEYRRVRDLSDDGALKLAQIIGSDQEWQVPFMGYGITIMDCDATIEGYVMVASGFRNYRHPRFLFDGKGIEPAYQRLEEDEWERHLYGPVTFPLTNVYHRLQMRRIGTPKIRVNTSVRSNNFDVRVRQSLVLLDYIAEFALRRSAE